MHPPRAVDSQGFALLHAAAGAGAAAAAVVKKGDKEEQEEEEVQKRVDLTSVMRVGVQAAMGVAAAGVHRERGGKERLAVRWCEWTRKGTCCCLLPTCAPAPWQRGPRLACLQAQGSMPVHGLRLA